MPGIWRRLVSAALRRLRRRRAIPGQAEAIGEATISARVYRAATGTWEELGVVSRGAVISGRPIHTEPEKERG